MASYRSIINLEDSRHEPIPDSLTGGSATHGSTTGIDKAEKSGLGEELIAQLLELPSF